MIFYRNQFEQLNKRWLFLFQRYDENTFIVCLSQPSLSGPPEKRWYNSGCTYLCERKFTKIIFMIPFLELKKVKFNRVE